MTDSIPKSRRKPVRSRKARAVYEALSYSYPGAIDMRTYAGTSMLVPCTTIRIAPATLHLPDKLVGKRVWVKAVVEEA